LQSEAALRVLSEDKNNDNYKTLGRLAAVETYRIHREILNLVNQKQDKICNLDVAKFANKYFEQNSYPDAYYSSAITSKLNKANSLMLEAEMTQKILQIKANKNQIHPTKINSQICSGSKWNYKQLANRKWSISLDKKPIWASKQPNINLSYIYSQSI
jgi:ribosomal protein L11 methylase PrmA